ncbi:hypothetical protein LSAC_00974 [Levilinea saccharolytica]|nr:hypothetical protein LSAC_00974 [Levilinea saccharolytica]
MYITGTAPINGSFGASHRKVKASPSPPGWPPKGSFWWDSLPEDRLACPPHVRRSLLRGQFDVTGHFPRSASRPLRLRGSNTLWKWAHGARAEKSPCPYMVSLAPSRFKYIVGMGIEGVSLPGVLCVSAVQTHIFLPPRREERQESESTNPWRSGTFDEAKNQGTGTPPTPRSAGTPP